MSRGVVLAGCGDGAGSPVPEGFLAELASATGADEALAARSGGRGVGPGVAEALMELRRRGVREALVATTHLVAGAVHRRCAAEALRAAGLFGELRLASPLLAAEKDARSLAAALDEALPATPGRAVLLAGHDGDAAGLAHLALEHALWARGRTDALVGAPARLGERTRAAGAREVLLAPLTMSVGTHARRDVLGALRATLERDGLRVETRERGLLGLPEARALVTEHALHAPVVGAPAPRGAADGSVAEGAPAPASVPGRFPLFVDLAGAPCLVVGCGAVGSRRARALLAHGARVTVVDPAPAAAVPEGARLLRRPYEEGDERGARLVVAAASDRAANALVASRCRAAGVPVSVADAPGEGTFAFPALCETDRLVAGVVSRAGEHALVAAAAGAVRGTLTWVSRSAGGDGRWVS